MKKVLSILLVIITILTITGCQKSDEEALRDWVASHALPIIVQDTYSSYYGFHRYVLTDQKGETTIFENQMSLPGKITKVDFWNPDPQPATPPEQTLNQFIYSVSTTDQMFDSIKLVHKKWAQERADRIKKETAEQRKKFIEETTITTTSSNYPPAAASDERRDGFGNQIYTQPNGEDKVFVGDTWIDPQY